MGPISTCALFGILALHVGATACAWGTRIAVNSRAEAPIQLLFLLAMAAVGFTAWHGHRHELGLGIPSGMTLIAMVVMAVSDFRRTHEPAHRRTVTMHS